MLYFKTFLAVQPTPLCYHLSLAANIGQVLKLHLLISYCKSSPLQSHNNNKTKIISLQEQCVTQHQLYLTDFNFQTLNMTTLSLQGAFDHAKL